MSGGSERGPRGGQPLHGFPKLLQDFSAVISCSSLFLMVVVTFIDVFGRNLHKPLPGASEIVSFLLGITFYAGLTMVTLQRAHIAVGVLGEHLPLPLRHAERWFTWVVSIGCVFLYAWMAAVHARTLWQTDYITDYLEWPLAWIVIAMTVLGAVAVVAALTLKPDPLKTAAVGASKGEHK